MVMARNGPMCRELVPHRQTFQRAPFQSCIGISIQYFKHFNLTFRTFQSVRQLLTQSGGTRYGPQSHDHISAGSPTAVTRLTPTKLMGG